LCVELAVFRKSRGTEVRVFPSAGGVLAEGGAFGRGGLVVLFLLVFFTMYLPPSRYTTEGSSWEKIIRLNLTDAPRVKHMKTHKIAATLAIALTLAGCNQPKTLTNPTSRADSKAKIIKVFFNGDWVSNDKYDTVIHSHVFEHVHEPNVFMENLSSFMQNGSKLIFSVPNMQEMIKRKYTNRVNVEHTLLLSEPHIEFLLARHGFRLVAKEYFLEDHSIFYAAEKDSAIYHRPNLDGLYARNKKFYSEYLQYHEDLIADLNENVARYEGDLFLFGAHVFAQYLINMGLDTRSVISILDNDENKQGKRLYGTNLLVESPKVLKDRIKPVVILKAGVYNVEIRAEILQLINDSTVVVE
jgi:SAM-dependent methyltransferase